MTFHLDRGSILSHEVTPEGFLRVYMRVARTGELKYRNIDGTERIEIVAPEVLFNKASMDSFKMKPLTLQHPPIRVTAQNARQYQRGMTGHYAIVDGDFLGLVGTVTDQEAIDAILSGKSKELSCGYDCEVRKQSDGKYEQTSRKGNHIAIVQAGRAGPGASFHLDSFEPLWIEKEEVLSGNMNNFRHDTNGSSTDNSMFAFGRVSWMFGDNGERFDFQNDAIEQAQKELVQMIESASRTPQRRDESRGTSRSDRTTAYEDTHEDAYSEESAIKKAQREMIAEIEAASRQNRR